MSDDEQVRMSEGSEFQTERQRCWNSGKQEFSCYGQLL